MDAALEELLGTLLYEGYALYPYTPGATKNATPTPFGIVYPPAYAQATPATFDKLRMQGIARADGDAVLAGEVRFLQGAGDAPPGRAAPPRGARAPARRPGRDAARRAFEHGGAARTRADVGRRPRRRPLARDALRAQHDAGAPRASTAPARWRRACSPRIRSSGSTAGASSRRWRRRRRESVNTFPVLATDADDALLGAAIVLPDHPQLAPESRGDLFDGTEIEEALLLHVLALSDGEREEISARRPGRARDDRARRRGDARGHLRPARATVLSDPAPPHAEPPGETRGRASTASPTAGATRSCCASSDRPDPYDRILDGRVATLERIYFDYDDKLYFGVTVDDDPGQELMRETGRFLFFFAGELEVCQT